MPHIIQAYCKFTDLFGPLLLVEAGGDMEDPSCIGSVSRGGRKESDNERGAEEDKVEGGATSSSSVKYLQVVIWLEKLSGRTTI